MSHTTFDDPTQRATAPEDPELLNTLRRHGPGRTVFKRFQLLRELGSGGMAVVWLAKDERLGLEVALKFLPGMVAGNPEAVDDLRREITRGLNLTHPGIVRVYDLHENPSEGITAIAMEYVSGSTLAEEKARQPGRCFEAGELLFSWTKALCEVLSYVHEEGKIVHRDLKPSNLMLTAKGRLKVADFGIAATLCDNHSRLTRNPSGSGTPVYMSPQQAQGRIPSAADDIYALGATLYELLTSKPPFFRGNMAIILNQVAGQIPPSMLVRRKELGLTDRTTIPFAWEKTIAACLAKEPEEWPASVREVASLLGLAPAGRAVPPTVGQPAPREEPPPLPRGTRRDDAGTRPASLAAALSFLLPVPTRPIPWLWPAIGASMLVLLGLFVMPMSREHKPEQPPATVHPTLAPAPAGPAKAEPAPAPLPSLPPASQAVASSLPASADVPQLEGHGPAEQTKEFPGERFPETRTRLLTEAEVRNWNQDVFRYAIDELYARHGADFSDPEVRRWFAPFVWYLQAPPKTYAEVEAEFSEIERANVSFLRAYRDRPNPTPAPVFSRPAPTLVPRPKTAPRQPILPQRSAPPRGGSLQDRTQSLDHL